MTTRRAEPGGELREERFASSPEYSGSINALVAAKRIELIENRELRELLWFIQYLSLSARGLKKLAADLLSLFPDRIGTPTMRRIRAKTSAEYSREQFLRYSETRFQMARAFFSCAEMKPYVWAS